MSVSWWVHVVVSVIAFAACKGEPPPGPKLVTRIPHVDKPDVVAADASDTQPPPLVIVVGRDGTLGLAKGPAKWSALAMYAPPSKLRLVTLRALSRFFGEVYAFGKNARAELPLLARIERDLVEAAKATSSVDDPPPPEDDPPPPEDEEMDLDEMPAERMKKAPEKPPLPTTSRSASYSEDGGEMDGGWSYGRAGPGPPGGHPGGWTYFPKPPPKARRMTSGTGEPEPNIITGTQAVIAAEPTAKATTLVDAVGATEGAILVEVAGALRVLRVQFTYDREREQSRGPIGPFVEVRATAAGLEVEGIPSPPIKLAWDLGALMKTIAATIALPRFKASAVDILVGDDVSAQQLVDLIVALDRGGIGSIGIGKLLPPDHAEWKLRGKWMRVFKRGRISGDEVRDTFKAADPALLKCYEDALITNPAIEGRAKLEFTVDAKGTVTKASATGIDPLVGDCLSSTITKLQFPKRTTKDLVAGAVEIEMYPHPR